MADGNHCDRCGAPAVTEGVDGWFWGDAWVCTACNTYWDNEYGLYCLLDEIGLLLAGLRVEEEACLGYGSRSTGSDAT